MPDGIEYNLYQYLNTELSTLNYSVNGYNTNSSEENIVINGSSGTPEHWYDRTDWQVQLISRADDKKKARKNLYLVYNKLKNRFGLILPEITIDGDIYEAVTTAQISPIQSPGYIGADEAGREMFSFNIIITTK